MLFVKNRWKIKLPELKIYQKHFSTVNQEALKAWKDYESSWGTLRLIILFLLLYLFNLLYSFIFYYLIYLFNLFYLFYLFIFSFILYYISSNPFQLMCLELTRIWWGHYTVCFIYSFVFQVIRDKTMCSKEFTSNSRDIFFMKLWFLQI